MLQAHKVYLITPPITLLNDALKVVVDNNDWDGCRLVLQSYVWPLLKHRDCEYFLHYPVVYYHESDYDDFILFQNFFHILLILELLPNYCVSESNGYCDGL